LRRKVGAIIAALKTRANSDGSWRALLRKYMNTQDKLDGSEPYYRALGFTARNGHKWAGANPTKRIKSQHWDNLGGLLRKLGAVTEDAPLRGALEAQHRWLDQALAAITRSGPPGATTTSLPSAVPEFPDPEWRLIERPAVVQEVIDKLASCATVALVGMSGIGKSILIRQILRRLDANGDARLFIDAREWLASALSVPAEPSPENYVGLSCELLTQLANHCKARTPPRQQYTLFRTRLTDLCAKWSLAPQRRAAADDSIARETFFSAVHAETDWQDFVSALASHAMQFRTLAFLADLASVLRVGLGKIVVVIDDVWNLRAGEQIITPLFLPSAGGPTPECPRLLVTSVEPTPLDFLAGSALIHLGQSHAAALDTDLAHQTIAAWAVQGQPFLSADAAATLIGGFRQTHIDPRPEVRKGIDAVLARVGVHPLALAAIACAWRDQPKTYPEKFWLEAAKAIDDEPENILVLNPNMPSGGIIPKRLYNILSALRFAWSLLDEATRERYLDLAISPLEEPINEELFHLLWERVDRAKTRLGPVMAGSRRPLRMFSEKSLTQISPERSQHHLHFLHRQMITSLLGHRSEQALAERHRDLLRATGFLDGDDRFLLDEMRHFRQAAGNRTIVWPALQGSVDDDELEDCGQYLLQHLPEHVRAMLPLCDAQRACTRVLTSYRFLQACLDFSLDDTAADAGNTDFLLTTLDKLALDFLDAAALEIVLSLRSTTPALARDRHQLAVQILAYVTTGNADDVDRLRTSAAAFVPKPAFVPRTQILPTRLDHLVCRIEEDDLTSCCLVQTFAGDPAILITTGDGRVELRDPRSLDAPLIQRWNHPGLEGAAYVCDSRSGATLMSWSANGSIHLWDGVTGRPRPHGAMQHGIMNKKPNRYDSTIKGVRWLADGGDGHPVILSWGADRTLRTWNAATGDLMRRSGFNGVITDALPQPGVTCPALLAWTDENVFLWRSAIGEQILRLAGGFCRKASWISDATPDPKLVIARDNYVNVYDCGDPEPQRVGPFRHVGGVTHAEWISDCYGAPAILSSSVDRPHGENIHLWRPVAGSTQAFAELNHSASISSLAWIPDALGAPAVLVSYDDGTVRLWRPKPWPHATLVIDRGYYDVAAAWVSSPSLAPFILRKGCNQFGGVVHLFDPNTGIEQPIAPVHHDRPINSATWFPDLLGAPSLLTWTAEEVCLWRVLHA
jgi:WD40 repeat protein